MQVEQLLSGAAATAGMNRAGSPSSSQERAEASGDLAQRAVPATDWPNWIVETPYVAAAHPQQRPRRPIGTGANCQRYAYAVLELFGLSVPDHRSSELAADPDLEHPPLVDARDLDLALFNTHDEAWGAHVAVVLSGHLLHLSAEVGRPAVWTWQDFADRPRYRVPVGLVRVPRPAATRSWDRSHPAPDRTPELLAQLPQHVGEIGE